MDQVAYSVLAEARSHDQTIQGDKGAYSSHCMVIVDKSIPDNRPTLGNHWASTSLQINIF